MCNKFTNDCDSSLFLYEKIFIFFYVGIRRYVGLYTFSITIHKGGNISWSVLITLPVASIILFYSLMTDA